MLVTPTAGSGSSSRSQPSTPALRATFFFIGSRLANLSEMVSFEAGPRMSRLLYCFRHLVFRPMSDPFAADEQSLRRLLTSALDTAAARPRRDEVQILD